MRRRTRPVDDGTVRLELDLPHELVRPPSIPLVRQIESLLREQPVEEEGSVLARSANLVEVLAELGYDRADHWEVVPGGWLPLPEATHRGRTEPVAHLVRALRGTAWGAFGRSDAFRARLSSSSGDRAEIEVLRLHRERQHSIRVTMWGSPSASHVRRLTDGLRRRFHPLRIRLSR